MWTRQFKTIWNGYVDEKKRERTLDFSRRCITRPVSFLTVSNFLPNFVCVILMGGISPGNQRAAVHKMNLSFMMSKSCTANWSTIRSKNYFRKICTANAV